MLSPVVVEKELVVMEREFGFLFLRWCGGVLWPLLFLPDAVIAQSP
jgi:hypothetical protein